MSASSAAVNESATAALGSLVKRRQASLCIFFGTGDITTRKASFLETHDRRRTPDFPVTPPTPVSPHTPQTPPSLQEAHSTSPPTPVTANVFPVFKKAKQDNVVNSQHDLVRSAVPILRHGKKKILAQTYLDLGQGDFGKRTICSTCGMLYVHGLNEDAQQHSRICLDYMKGIPFNVSHARVVDSDSVGSIVEVRGMGMRYCVSELHIVRVLSNETHFSFYYARSVPQTTTLFEQKSNV